MITWYSFGNLSKIFKTFRVSSTFSHLVVHSLVGVLTCYMLLTRCCYIFLAICFIVIATWLYLIVPMDLAWLSQIAFRSLGCNPNSNAISVQFLEYFSENITLWERKRERERDFSSTRSYLLFVGCWEGLDEMEVGFTTFFFFHYVCRCITFMDIFLKSEPDKRRL